MGPYRGGMDEPRPDEPTDTDRHDRTDDDGAPAWTADPAEQEAQLEREAEERRALGRLARAAGDPRRQAPG